MIALDTNILVHARREEAEFHIQAKDLLLDLAEGERPWALAWPCVYEFLRVVTHPKIFNPPTRLEIALEDLDSLLDSPSLTMLGQGPDRNGSRPGGNLSHSGWMFKEEREPEGWAIQSREAWGEVVGHVAVFEPALIAALHVADGLMRSPLALATFLESCGKVTLERAGAILAARFDE